MKKMKISLSRKKCVFRLVVPRPNFGGGVVLLWHTRLHVIKNGILKSNSLNLDRNLNQQHNMFSGVISSVLRRWREVKININFGADSRLTKC